MKQRDVVRKALSFGADALIVTAAALLCNVQYHQDSSVYGERFPMLSFVLMLLIIMALISTIIKTYHLPVTENVISSMVLSIGAFFLSLSFSALFMYLIDNHQPNVIELLNFFVYATFFLVVYRLALAAQTRSVKSAKSKSTTAGSRRQHFHDASNICVEELLGRDPVTKEEHSAESYIADSTVLVAGGAGTVGFELCNQLLRLNAKRVVILDSNENKLLETETELSLRYTKNRFVICIGSIQDRARLREVFDLYRPQLVVHAASYKHATVLEHSPQEALKNNVMGTLYLVEMAIKHRVDRFILLSADNANNPTNIVGASKRVAEMLIQRANDWSETRFSAVRFGAAIGNCGGIIHLFQKQIESGGPVYVPDKGLMKYMMTIPEAAKLILDAGRLMRGGEVFALEPGTPVNLYELATSMIRRYGLRPGKDIKLEITGSLPAEKAANEKILEDKKTIKTLNDKICILKENENPPVTFEEIFDTLCQSIDSRDYGAAYSKISVLVPTFRNICVS